MRINIISVGKVNKELRDILSSYMKKINFYSQINLIEIKEINEKNMEIKKFKETELILRVIPKHSLVYLCSLEGKEYDSPAFSEMLVHNMTFIIGGSNGIVETHFENKIKFSNLTFPHKLFKVMLIEQIYRGLTIINNGKYHK
jgi:23S rRNA (pseudouridine1915-N3)-methyltransferase